MSFTQREILLEFVEAGRQCRRDFFGIEAWIVVHEEMRAEKDREKRKRQRFFDRGIRRRERRARQANAYVILPAAIRAKTVCDMCGANVELREGYAHPIHVGVAKCIPLAALDMAAE